MRPMDVDHFHPDLMHKLAIGEIRNKKIPDKPPFPEKKPGLSQLQWTNIELIPPEILNLANKRITLDLLKVKVFRRFS